MSAPNETLVHASRQLLKAQQLLLLQIEEALQASKLPPLIWYDVLSELERAGPNGLRPFQLARLMMFKDHNLSRLLARIERAGHVIRRECEADRRGQLVAITPKGLLLCRKTWPVYVQAVEKAVGAKLTDEETGSLYLLTGKLVSRLD